MSGSGERADPRGRATRSLNGDVPPARPRELVRVDQPLVLITQVQRSGGTLLQRLLDGHPQCHVLPFQFRGVDGAIKRAVSDPHGALEEFGLELDDDVELRVLDSAADVRYLVLPRRPQGSEGLEEEELASLVARSAMTGVAQPAAPGRA